MLPNKESARGLYQQLQQTREPFLLKARRCAELTLPFLVPPAGATPGKDYPTPYQSVGARGVVNLAAKLLLALLPPNAPFFKLQVDPFELKKLEQDPKVRTALDSALSEMEQAVQLEIETSATRVSSFESILSLVVAGNVLLEVPEDGNLKVYRLDRFVVQRDPMGNVMTTIIHETVAPNTLPKDVQKQLGKEDKDKTVDLYTICKRTAKGWKVWQEVRDLYLPDSDGFYPTGKCPFIPLRFQKIDGEDYGRGFVEQYLGDLSSLESLSQALVEGSLAAAKIMFLVNPSGLTNPTKLAKAYNGDFVQGREEDVHCLQLEKQADLNVAFQQAQAIEKRLETAFLLMSSIQRNAERVTAEEIRALIQELETSLGGVYSVLAQEFQLPLATVLMDRMAKEGRLPKLPKKIVKPTVTTGLEALGRGNDLQKLDAFMAGALQAFGPQVLQQYVNPSEYFTRRATAQGINIKGLIRSDEEIQAQNAQAQQSQQTADLVGKLGPEAMRQAGAALNPKAA